MEEYPGKWTTVPTESENEPSMTIFVTGRLDVDKFRDSSKYDIRIDVTLPYTAGYTGMPEEEPAELLKSITDRLISTFQKDKVAVLTGIYTGAGERNWIFYTRHIGIFQKRFNQALEDLPTLPFKIYAENDSSWAEYSEMRGVLPDTDA